MSSRQLTDGAKLQDVLKRGPRFGVRFLHEPRAAPLLQKIRRIALGHAEFRVQRHHFLALRFARGVNVARKRCRAEGRNIRPHTLLGQPVKRLPFVLDHLPAEAVLPPALRCTRRLFRGPFPAGCSSHLLNLMHRIAPFGRMLDLVQQLRKTPLPPCKTDPQPR